MKSPLPKVLHPVAGIPMIRRVVETAKAAGADEVRVVVGFGESMVREVVEPLGAVCFRQQNQRGTGDAVRAAQPENLSGLVVILNGDHPLLEVADVQRFVNEFHESAAHVSVVSCTLEEPGSYGRIVRNQGRVWAIVEAKDSTHESRKIHEINTGIYVTRAEILNEYLPKVQPHNAQSEYYLTDIVALANQDNKRVEAITSAPHVAKGVNTQAELAEVTAAVFKRKVEKLMNEGVIVTDPHHTYVEDAVTVGEGSVLYPNVHLRGTTQIGQMVVIEPGSIITSSKLANGVRVKAGSYIDHSVVHEQSEIGPYAHLRPQTEIGKECKVGNFVEMKKVKFGDGAKASHLTYLGDAIIGNDTNIGCGTITCNYAVDRKKYVTRIGANVFVGSDTQFVAPIEVGDNAVIASGSTITKNVPAGALAVARGKQMIKENYKPKLPGDSSDQGK